MKLISKKRLMGLLKSTIIAAVALISLAAPANAQNLTVSPYEADASFDAFNANFLVQSGGYTYYNDELNSSGTSEAKLWAQTLAIYVAEDNYERTHSTAAMQLVSALLNTVETDFGSGKDWSYDGWNDDIAWMSDAFFRGYRITGNADYLDVAKKNYDMAYARGWDTTLGGGIYENSTKTDKECLSNDPFVWEGVDIYDDTGDASYLAKAESDYTWVRGHLFNSTSSPNAIGPTGCLCQGERLDGTLESGDNVYNSGTFLEAANALYHATKNVQYFDDAVLDIDHVISNGPVLNNHDEGDTNQWAYWFVKGLSDFCTDNNQWPKYYPWLLGNANAAWSVRDSANLTWNDWTAQTTDSGANPLEMSSAVVVWQVLNVPTQCMIVSRKDGRTIDLIGGNQTDGAVIGMWPPSNFLDSAEHWMVVPASGHKAIISGATGMAATVLAGATSSGAKLVDGKYSLGSTSMLWDFVPQADGWSEIKNIHSGLVLTAPSGTGDNMPIVQSAANGQATQEWKIQPFISFAGHYEIQCAESGDAVGVGTESAVTQTPYVGADQQWTFASTSRGYYKISGVTSGKDLAVTGASYIRGSNIIVQTNSIDDENQWEPVQNADGTFCLYNLNSGMVLDDPGGTNSGAQFDQWGWNDGKNQEFKLISVP